MTAGLVPRRLCRTLVRRAAEGLATLVVALSAGCSDPACGTGGHYDLLVTGGTIVDGTGRPGFPGGVAVCGDRIVEVGALAGATAPDTLDATGLVVAPGFIDALGQSEYTILRDGRALSKITQGITSEVTGEVTSVVPVNEAALRELPSSFRALATWTDLDGYFEAVERTGVAINVGTFVTAGSVRQHVLGRSRRPPTPAELRLMQELVRAAVRQGAMGLSAGLAYAPAAFASTEEVAALASAAAELGGGYATHLRSEGDSLLPAVREAIRIGESAGTWVHIHHLKAAGPANWGKVSAVVAVIDSARRHGVDVTADMYPYAASATALSSVFSDWAHEGGRDSLLARIRESRMRSQLREELRTRWSKARSREPGSGPGSIMINGVGEDSLRRYVGMRLDRIAAGRGQPPEDALLSIIEADAGRTTATLFSMSETDLETALRQPWTAVGTDAGARSFYRHRRDLPHPRTFGTFPRVLCRYVRDRGLLPLEEAVRRFTSLPATRFRLHGRGRITPGAYADLAIFHPDRTCDRATYTDPVRVSVGIRHVVVNGVPVLREGHPTGAYPGRPLRSGPAVQESPSKPSEGR